MVAEKAAHNDMCKWLLTVLKNDAALSDMFKWLLTSPNNDNVQRWSLTVLTSTGHTDVY